MPNRHRDWLQQAEWELEHARVAARETHFEWAAFVAGQGAGKALKASILASGASRGPTI